MHKSDIKAIVRAIALAEKSEYKQRHGAVLFKGNKTFGGGYNKLKTHPLADKQYKYPYLHAELDAVIKVAPPPGVDIAVVRINNHGVLQESHPCEHCMKLLKDRKIRNLIYSTNDGIKKVSIR